LEHYRALGEAEGAAEGHYYRTVPDPLDIGGEAYVQDISTRSVDDLVKAL
jgi:hypothetical protein